MGWWGYDILGGDQPLDELANIGDKMGVEYDFENESGLGGYLNGYQFTKEIVEKHFDALVAGANPMDYDGQIRLQVLGVVALAVGATIAETKIEKILEAVEKDQWAAEGEPQRQEKMDQFAEKLRNHKKK